LNIINIYNHDNKKLNFNHPSSSPTQNPAADAQLKEQTDNPTHVLFTMHKFTFVVLLLQLDKH